MIIDPILHSQEHVVYTLYRLQISPLEAERRELVYKPTSTSNFTLQKSKTILQSPTSASSFTFRSQKLG